MGRQPVASLAVPVFVKPSGEHLWEAFDRPTPPTGARVHANAGAKEIVTIHNVICLYYAVKAGVCQQPDLKVLVIAMLDLEARLTVLGGPTAHAGGRLHAKAGAPESV